MDFMRSVSVLAFCAAGMGSTSAAQAQSANVTPANVNLLNLLSPYLSLNATGVGQTTLQDNLQQSLAINNGASLAQQQLAISDKNLLGSVSNNLSSVGLGTYGTAANLAGGLPPQTPVNGITPQQPVGGLGAQLGPIYQTGVASGTGGPLANTVTLLASAYGFTSSDLGTAKNYFANGTTNGTITAVGPAGFTLPTFNGLPNTTNSVYDVAYGVTNQQPGQNIFGSSRPVQVVPGKINQFDPTALNGLATNPSFPSGHATYAYTDSLLLAMLVPQDYQSMLSRGSEYANSRIVLGVHYPLDIIASRALASYDLSQAFTNAAYIDNAGTTGTAINLPTLYTAAAPELQTYLAAQCGASVATCATSAANTANDPYVPSAANQTLYQSRLTYGLPTLTFAQAPRESAPAGGPDASILLAPLYGGSTAAATQIAPAGGLYGNLQTSTINQILVNTETNALAAFYGTALSYWTRIDLYAASGYFGNVTGSLSLAPSDTVTTDVTIGNGGTLSGTGTVGNVAVAAGGTLAPGGSAAIGGTMTVGGTLSFAPGSFYNVRITPTTGDRTNVAGPAALNGTVNVAAGTGVYAPQQQYTILTAAGGRTGTFSGASTNLAFLSPSLSYDGQDVVLSLQALPFNTVAQTANQNNVGNALTFASQRNPSGAGAALIGNLQQATAAQGRAALDSLSGEGITAAQSVAHRSVSEFTSAIFDQTTFYAGANPANSVVLTEGLPPGVLGYAPLTDSPVKLRDPLLTRQRTWRAWATGFGGAEDIHGDAGLGSAGQTSTIYGGTLGVDYQITPDYLIGVAVGGSNGDFQVNGRATSGSTTGGHVAFYDLATFGAFYGASSTSASFFTNRTTRAVGGIGALGSETERGTFDSHEFRSRLEFGRHFDAYGATITPFVALEIAELRSNGFGETSLTGPGDFALNVSGQSTASVPGFVGARYQGKTTLGNGMLIAPILQVAYVHEFAPERSQIGTLAALPGSAFLVDGARPDRNAAQVKTGVELALSPASAVFANFDGEFSGKSQFYGGKGGFKYVW